MKVHHKLKNALNEKDVENTYRQGMLERFKGSSITSPYGSDGFLVSQDKRIKTLLEFKYNEKAILNDINHSLKVVAQCIFYVKKFHNEGANPSPTTIFIGDNNECLVIHTNDIHNYLSGNYKWELPPSSAHLDVDLMKDLLDDKNLNHFVFTSENFSQCLDDIEKFSKGITRLVMITEKNITEVFRHFENTVLGKNSLSTNEKANLFVQLLINPDDNFLYPSEKRKLIQTKSFGDVSVKCRRKFESFFSHFSKNYTPTQKAALTAVVDRLVEDTTRRKNGEFFTPAIWVDKAHDYIVSVYGEDWREKYVVWDPAWGTGNLTRDYIFKELYVSTLNQSDIDTAEQMGYNPGAHKFQYDFLNDDYEKIPEGLRNAIESGRDVIVLMNPPYGRSTGVGGRFSSISMGATSTKVSKEMKNKKVSGSDNFYTQFFYQCVNLGIKNIASFTPSNFQTGVSFKKFRDFFYENVELNKGYIFQASNFSDVADDWSIQFSVFSEGVYNEDCTMDILIQNENYDIVCIGSKKLISTDNAQSLKEWVDEYNEDVIDFPKFSSPLNIKETKWGSGIKENSFGTLVFNSNSPSKNAQSVYITSGGITENVGKENFNGSNIKKLLTIFSVRRLVKGDWLNWYDEYLAPNEEHEQFEQFKNDSIVYSLFESKSNQSSLRQVEYKDKLWDIKNEFFWLPADLMKSLADENHYDELYRDSQNSPNRHVYKLLFGEQQIYNKLSPDAKAVLDKASELVAKSMKERKFMADSENHLNAWDAGYAQLKLVWKEYFPEEFKEFRDLYKELEERMTPLVYELGFLLK